ncbi:MAG: ferredoxin-thioredoxin reductase catalytic domain-containing protein [Candidatus Marinimicrobia bacterium]|nr:ferredoxin-thioredoxin reductase catalytic domain-containing protein [Candidatus Neomarinimicrobiota bacterium]
MTADQLFEALKNTQEPKGYFFNPDREHVFRLLNSLLLNKARYSYMACPCRLAANDRGWDMDILCPCIYRDPDVKEFGRCYCGLYVSADWLAGKIANQYVPERRSVDKLFRDF